MSLMWNEGFWACDSNEKINEYTQHIDDPREIEEFTRGWDTAEALREVHRRRINRG